MRKPKKKIAMKMALKIKFIKEHKIDISFSSPLRGYVNHPRFMLYSTPSGDNQFYSMFMEADIKTKNRPYKVF